MFGRLFGRKTTPPPDDDNWLIAQAVDAEMPKIFRVRNAKPRDLKTEEYPNLLIISWQYDGARSNGMPSGEVNERMETLETRLTEVLESEKEAYLVVAITGAGLREWLWYARNLERTMELLNSGLKGVEPFPIEFSNEQDPAWEAFGQIRRNAG